MGFAVAQVNKGGDGGGVFQSQHGRVVFLQKTFFHHAFKDFGENARSAFQEVLGGQLAYARIMELLGDQQLAGQDDLRIIHGKADHAHGHLYERLPGLRRLVALYLLF